MELIQDNHPRFGWGSVWHINAGGQPLCDDEFAEGVETKTAEILPRGCHVCRDCAAIYHRFEVGRVRGGQVRKYGPMEYVYTVTDLADEKRSAEEVETFCRKFVQHAYRATDPNDHPDDTAWPHFRPTIKGFSQTSPGVWRYFVYEASTH